jgi:membrane protein implicated in regulation of membrane protease activity
LDFKPVIGLAVITELVLLLFFLLVDPVAAVLHHAAPTSVGVAFAILAFPAVLLADSLHKYFRARKSVPDHRAP